MLLLINKAIYNIITITLTYFNKSSTLPPAEGRECWESMLHHVFHFQYRPHVLKLFPPLSHIQLLNTWNIFPSLCVSQNLS